MSWKFSPYTIPIIRQVLPRRFQLYCIGTAKSGTHSIASVFSPLFKSKHEPYSEQAIEMILDLASGKADNAKLMRFLKNKERLLNLEVNSSQLNYFFLETLVAHFPEAKFILTIREPYAWLKSYINHQLGRKEVSSNWQQFRDYRFKNPAYTFSVEDMPLNEYQLYPIDSYLSYWAKHNRDVLKLVPKERLLILRTDQISDKLDEIADFVDIDEESLRVEASHTYRAVKKFNILEQIDSEFLAERINYHCQPLVDQFFSSS
ncbi:sulfotransferase [Candidatus Leptofilum sp.]|uniref:sulfotransferase n=1 Tax=Candidatus Leptofilum sp. TaxID=3241576 RepID=UPI003B5C74B4